MMSFNLLKIAGNGLKQDASYVTNQAKTCYGKVHDRVVSLITDKLGVSHSNAETIAHVALAAIGAVVATLAIVAAFAAPKITLGAAALGAIARGYYHAENAMFPPPSPTYTTFDGDSSVSNSYS